MNCRKNCSKLVFCVFPKQLLCHINSGWLRCYEDTVKKYKKPLLQKSETKIFKQKRFHEKLVQSQREKKLGLFEIKSENVLITISKFLQLNC